MTNKPENELSEAIGTRIKERRGELKLSRTALAEDVGVALSTMQAWENGEREPAASFILRLAESLSTSAHWLITGDTLGMSGTSHKAASDVLGNSVDIEEFAFIPRYDVRAAAGHGALNETETPKFPMAFRKYWIKNFLNADPHHLFVITVDGSSLEGTLNDGDNILVNGADTDPKEGIYVLRVDGHLLVKLVQRVPGGLLKVSSTNTAYEPFTVDMNNQPEDFAVIGRVVWFGRTI
ncbi:XRE family transcriptional regulator [Pectobacterium brasiliense]|uniref:XRE family transcriptional regulator n=1 Tax=Pectobacterium brasiliense TaxID=180957 RepID=UPI00196970CF|nr:helix-turn-helix transcriptional regulator [Pectobacterium brasiliense]MBN3068185.1 helix-turn-helix transcriptional regulator [Pectobacterium brasiliense]